MSSSIKTSTNFEFEIVTPLFLSGADGNTPELRAPSFKGVMRWWFRAMVGSMVNDVKTLRQREFEVFGSTQEASKIGVRIIPQRISRQSFNPLPHREMRFSFSGFEPGGRINFILSSRSDDSSHYKTAILSLLFLSYFGGVGKRARRGFGSLKLTNIEGDIPSEIKAHFRPCRDDFEHFQKILLELLNISMPEGVFTDKGPKEFCFFNPQTRIIILRKQFRTWEEALRQFGIEMRSYKDTVFGSANPRQASPLIVKVHKLGQFYHLMLTAFLGTKLVRSGDWNKMNRFLDKLKSKYKGVEIGLKGNRWSDIDE